MYRPLEPFAEALRLTRTGDFAVDPAKSSFQGMSPCCFPSCTACVRRRAESLSTNTCGSVSAIALSGAPDGRGINWFSDEQCSTRSGTRKYSVGIGRMIPTGTVEKPVENAVTKSREPRQCLLRTQ